MSGPSKRLCENYDLCECDDPRPAVVEVVDVYRTPGHDEWTVAVHHYCLPCARLDAADSAKLRRSMRQRGDGVTNGVVVRPTRWTWLTTLVNGEVPT